MLKASLEYLQPNSDRSFLLRNFGAEAFDAPYHFHPEYELTFIIHGCGKRYIGNHMGPFESGDLVLIGPDLPHCWKLEGTDADNMDASAMVIQFSRETLGEALLEKSELVAIRNLLQQASFGISFSEKSTDQLRESLAALAEKNGFYSLMAFLEILQRLAMDKAYRLLNQDQTIAMETLASQQRIGAVFAYLVENFREKVSLEEAASIANMTPSAFCKYFKKITRKTFMETVIEYRLNYATQQLIQTNKPVSEVSFDSGFADVSFFYRTFKKRMKLSPLNYRHHFMKQA